MNRSAPVRSRAAVSQNALAALEGGAQCPSRPVTSAPTLGEARAAVPVGPPSGPQCCHVGGTKVFSVHTSHMVFEILILYPLLCNARPSSQGGAGGSGWIKNKIGMVDSCVRIFELPTAVCL